MELLRERWDRQAYQDFLAYLNNLAEEDYRKFRVRIVKADLPILGVRQPLMRRLAGRILKGNAHSFLEIPKGPAFEEQMMHGYVLARIALPYEQKLPLILDFTGKMDNWSVCDDFVTALKPFIREYREPFLQDIRHLAFDENPWKVRFVLVVLLECYLEEDKLEEALSLCCRVDREEYYVKMAQAWLLSMAYVKNPERTLKAIRFFEKDRFVFLKSISKIMDSYQVSKEHKTALREMREEYKRQYGKSEYI